jgi:hypothetical protein
MSKKIERFDRTNLGLLRADLDAALSTVAAKWGINLSLGTGRFDPEVCNWKLSGNVVRGENVKTKEALEFERYADLFGLEASDLGAEFTQGRKRFKIIGAKLSSRKYPILARQLGGTGKTYKFSGPIVRIYLGKQPKAQAQDEQYVVIEDDGRFFVLDSKSNRRLRGPEHDGAFPDAEEANEHAENLNLGSGGNDAFNCPGFNNRHED